MIYADNAATTALSPAAFRAMQPFFSEICGNPSSLHAAGQAAKRALEDARARIAHCLNTVPACITFTSGGTESDVQALRSAAAIGAKNGKRRIISAAFEHHAVLRTLDALAQEGFQITLLPVSAEGFVSPDDLAAAITADTCLVSIMFANNEIGTIQPVQEIGAICRQHGVPFHTDAVQAAGHLPIDVQALNISMLSLSAHKFHGPKGIGVLFAERGIRLKSVITGGAQERGNRAGTENLPAIAGMAAALEESISRISQQTGLLLQRRNRLIEGLSRIPQSFLNGSLSDRLPTNVSFCFAGIEGESLLLMLDRRGICASSGSACASGAAEPSHVLRAIGRPNELARGSLRLSISADTTDAEIGEIIAAVTESVAFLRGMTASVS